MNAWSMIDSWIVATAAVIALSCALVGNFLVVRRMSLMGDAISHAVLPGIAVVFLLTGTRDPLPMFLGAVAAGLGTAFLTEWIHRHGRVEESSAMGVVFTTLFALGLVLIVQAADHVDLDPGCVLYGSIELSPLDTVSVAGWDVPRAFVIGLVVLLFNAALVFLMYKEFLITSFDPDAATALGIPARPMYYLLMAMVAVTTVASFESVGSILVIAMLIIPGAAAQFLSVRFSRVILWSLALAVLAAAGGHVLAITVPPLFGFSDTSTSGMMAVCCGLLFAAAFLFAPERGLVAKALALRSLKHRILREDVLGLLYRGEESSGTTAAGMIVDVLVEKTGSTRRKLNHILSRLVQDRLVLHTPAGLVALTEMGRHQAVTVIRDHRLWERFLHEKVNLPADHVHEASERLEHVTDDALRRELKEGGGDDLRDPHGKVIP